MDALTLGLSISKLARILEECCPTVDVFEECLNLVTGAVLGEDGVAVEAGRAQVTGGARCVVDALETVSRDAVARAGVVRVDVAGAVARLAVVSYGLHVT